MLDRAMQALYLLALSPVAETTGDASLLRVSTKTIHRRRDRRDAFILLSQRSARLNGSWRATSARASTGSAMSGSWPMCQWTDSILRKWLKAGFMDKRTLYPSEEGTPQGGIISPTLANLTLDGLQALLKQHFPVRSRQKVNLVRYADDFIITGASREVLEQQVRPLVERFLAERGLELSPDKTVITHIEQGFDFLGQNVRMYRR